MLESIRSCAIFRDDNNRAVGMCWIPIVTTPKTTCADRTIGFDDDIPHLASIRLAANHLICDLRANGDAACGRRARSTGNIAGTAVVTTGPIDEISSAFDDT